MVRAVERSLPREVARQEGQDEEPDVAGVETGVLVEVHSEECGHLDGHRRRGREAECDDGVRSRSGLRLAAVGGGHHELLPEAVRVLARELPGKGVEVAHALHRDQERLIGGEPRVDQHRDLLAQVVLQLRDVDGMDRLPASEVVPPLVDLLLERHPGAVGRHRQAPCGRVAVDATWFAGAGSASVRQMPRSVSSTACHCRCSSASWARPRDVMP